MRLLDHQIRVLLVKGRLWRQKGFSCSIRSKNRHPCRIIGDKSINKYKPLNPERNLRKYYKGQISIHNTTSIARKSKYLSNSYLFTKVARLSCRKSTSKGIIGNQVILKLQQIVQEWVQEIQRFMKILLWFIRFTEINLRLQKFKRWLNMRSRHEVF